MYSAFQNLISKCSSEEGLSDEDKVLMEKTKSRCQRFIQVSVESEEKAIQEYAQAVLDFTYIDENRLVDEEFPDSNAKQRIKTIFDLFQSIENLILELLPSKKMQEVLGTEISECLYWRRGALMYMFCSTLQEQKERVQENLQTFIESLLEGIRYLKQMILVRPSCDTSAAMDSTLSLLNLGIYSDTHLLALMYAGEMTYWYCTLKETINNPERPSIKQCGIELLQKYVTAVKGPLSQQRASWSTDRAEHILKYFNSSVIRPE